MIPLKKIIAATSRSTLNALAEHTFSFPSFERRILQGFISSFLPALIERGDLKNLNSLLIKIVNSKYFKGVSVKTQDLLIEQQLKLLNPQLKTKLGIKNTADLVQAVQVAALFDPKAVTNYMKPMTEYASVKSKGHSEAIRSIRYLITALRDHRPIPKKDVQEISTFWKRVSKNEIQLNATELRWLNRYAKHLITDAAHPESALAFLTQSHILPSVRSALKSTRAYVGSSAFYFDLDVLPRAKVSFHTLNPFGKTAGSLGLEHVYYALGTAGEYDELTRSIGEHPLIFTLNERKSGSSISAGGYRFDTWFSAISPIKYEVESHGTQAHYAKFRVDPNARLGVDFFLDQDLLLHGDKNMDINFKRNVLRLESLPIDLIPKLVTFAHRLNQAQADSPILKAIQTRNNPQPSLIATPDRLTKKGESADPMCRFSLKEVLLRALRY